MRLLQSILIALLLVPSWSGDVRVTLPDRAVRIVAEPVLLYPRDPARRRVGALVFEQGYRLRGTGKAFGGYSSLIVNGDQFLLLGDFGVFARFRLRGGRIDQVSTGALPAGPGSGWRKLDRDSEAMTIDPATGQIWVAFENANEIWRYDRALAEAERHAAPRSMRHWPINNGAEAFVRLHSGRFLAIAESDPWLKGKGRAAISFTGDPTIAPDRGFAFSYLPPKGHDPSDMAELPDGRIVVLNRRVALRGGLTVVVTIIDPRAIRPGALVRGREIARFAGDMLRDNFEGVAVVREGDATKLWIVSDDNQSVFQQTLLLKFRLDESGVASRPRVARRQ